MSDGNNHDNTTDCPICLCPIISEEPWGVCTPCGHPYHRACWDEVVANHTATTNGNGRRRRKNHPSCSICNGATQGFVQVFLDLSSNDETAAAAAAAAAITNGGGVDGGGGATEEGIISLDHEHDELEEWTQEWDRLWRELKSLCGISCDKKEEEDGRDNHHRHLGRRSRGANADGGVIDVTGRSDPYVAHICATIDLTQPSPHREMMARDRSSNQKQNDNDDLDTTERNMEKFQQRQGRIKTILRRLQSIHNKLVQRCERPGRPSASAAAASNHRQIHRLKSKVQSLQGANTDLSSEITRLQSANEHLTTELEKVRQTVLDRTIEAERHQHKHATLETQFTSLEESYKTYIAKSNMEQGSLKERIGKLQSELEKVQHQASLEDMQEMEEIRRNYSKMSQELHDVKAKNARMQKAWDTKEREFQRQLASEKLLRYEGANNARRCGSSLRKGSPGGGGTLKRNTDGEEASDEGNRGNLRRPAASTKADATEKIKGAPTKASFDAATSADRSIHQRQSTAASNSKMGSTSSSEKMKRRALPKKSRAMEALDRTSSRRFSTNLKHASHHCPRQHNSLQHRPYPSIKSTSGDGENGDTVPAEAERSQRESVENTTTPEGSVQLLMMRTTSSHSLKKRRYGSSNSSSSNGSSLTSNAQTNDSAVASGKRRRSEDHDHRETNRHATTSSTKPLITATSKAGKKSHRPAAAIRQKGNISSFFKPVVDVDIR